MSDYFGKPVKRVENLRLITGNAPYLDDIQLPRITPERVWNAIQSANGG